MAEKTNEQLTELEECVLESANAGKPLWVHDGKSWYVAAFVKLEKQRLAIPDGDLGRTRGGLTYDLEKARMKKHTGRDSLEQVRPPFA